MKTYPKVLVYGGREFKDCAFVSNCLTMLENQIGAFCVVEGGAKGADTFAGMWADANGFPHVLMRAPWDYYKKAAGPIRNQWMRDVMQPHFGVEFPGGVGTANMRKLLDDQHVLVWTPATDPVVPPLMTRESVFL